MSESYDIYLVNLLKLRGVSKKTFGDDSPKTALPTGEFDFVFPEFGAWFIFIMPSCKRLYDHLGSNEIGFALQNCALPARRDCPLNA